MKNLQILWRLMIAFVFVLSATNATSVVFAEEVEVTEDDTTVSSEVETETEDVSEVEEEVEEDTTEDEDTEEVTEEVVEEETDEEEVVIISVPTTELSDISTHWSSDIVSKMVGVGLIAGYPDGTFMPENKLNRAEAAVLLHRINTLEVPAAATLAPFTDVTDLAAYYTPYVAALKSMGIVSGDTAGTFRPGSSITRAEFLTLAMNTYMYLMDDIDSAEKLAIEVLKAGPKTTKFSDLGDDWYTPFVTAAAEKGFVNGSACGEGMCFNATSEITRAEATTILYNIFGVMLGIVDGGVDAEVVAEPQDSMEAVLEVEDAEDATDEPVVEPQDSMSAVVPDSL